VRLGAPRRPVAEGSEALGISQLKRIEDFLRRRERLSTGPGMLPVTEALARRTLALPFHNHLSDEEIVRVVECLERAVG
jgi:perosamine synthetase